MNAYSIPQILAFAIVIIILILALTDHPIIFHYRPLRFLYRSGLLLYSGTFKVCPQVSKSNIPQWKLEHWMVASGFSMPRSEEDGEGRYLLAEFISPLFFPPLPLLLRAKISWDHPEKGVVVRGYSTWSYFSILAFLVIALFVSPSYSGTLCVGALLFVYLLWCLIFYLYQAPHFYSIGAKVADYLSSDVES